MDTIAKDLSLPTIHPTVTTGGGSSSSSSSSTTQSVTTPTINIAPPLPTSGSFTRGGRRLRKRGEKNYCDFARRNSVPIVNGGGTSSSSSSSCSTQATLISNSLNIPVSPLKNTAANSSQEVSLTELQTSLTMYFGAVNRISSGERFVVRGKRHGPDGRTQYLIEWESVL